MDIDFFLKRFLESLQKSPGSLSDSIIYMDLEFKAWLLIWMKDK
jgi:hypothetical protein